MKTWKIFPGICLVVIFTWTLVTAAFGALLTSDKQVVQLGAVSPQGDNSGILSFSKLMQINPNGTQTPFAVPIDKLLVITYLNIFVQPVDTMLNTNADLRMGSFYSRVIVGLSNGRIGYAENFFPGIVISPQGWGNNFYTVNLKNDVIIPGTVNVRILGYLVPKP